MIIKFSFIAGIFMHFSFVVWYPMVTAAALVDFVPPL